jgi:hypothetical protein
MTQILGTKWIDERTEIVEHSPLTLPFSAEVTCVGIPVSFLPTLLQVSHKY